MALDAPRIKNLLHEALQLESEAERDAFIASQCRDDVQLRELVHALVRSHEKAGDFFDRSTVPIPMRADIASDGDQIGRYKLLERIGEGGFGVVYVAEQREPVKRRVALKIIKLGMDTRQVVARFEAERQALAMMEHSNIAKVLDAGATETGRPYFVMELVRGVPITDYCDQNRLTIGERLSLFMAVCLAVQHAHQKGVIHRDIKPSNILVTLHDGAPVPKVIDFGIAKATNQELTEKTVFTQFRQMIGTPTYMSPEQAEMSGLDIDTRSDIYSLGVLLYELLTGKTPLDERNLLEGGYDEIRRRIKDDEPLKPSTRAGTLCGEERTTVAKCRKVEPARLGNDLRGDLDWIVMKALEKDRARRYDTAKGFANDIRRFLNREPVEAVPPTLGYRTHKFMRRHQVALLVTGVMAGLLASGTFISSLLAILAHRASVRERTAREEAQRAEVEAKAQAVLAQAGELAARRNLYVAAMNLAQRTFNEGNIDRSISLLQSQIPILGKSDLRGIEWALLWDRIHRHRSELFGHTADIHDLAISPDGEVLGSASVDGTTRIWELRSGRELVCIDSQSTRDSTVAISQDGRLLATVVTTSGGQQEILLWSLSELTEVQRLGGHPGFISRVRFSPDGKTLLAACSNGKVQVWNLSDRSAVLLDAHHSYVHDIGFTRDGSTFITCSHESTVRTWDLQTLTLTRTLVGHQGAVFRVACAPDRNFAASAGLYGDVIVWDLRTGEAIRNISFDIERDGPARSVAFSADGSTLAIGLMGGRVCLLRTDDWQQFASRYTSPLYALAFSPADDRFVIAGAEGRLTTMEFPAADSENLLSDPEDRPRSLRVSPDGRTLAVGIATGSIRIWDLATNQERFEIPGLRVVQPIMASPFDHHFFDFSPDGQTLATVTHTNRVDLWNLNSGTLESSILHSNRIYAVDWSPNGKRIAGGGPQGLVTFWTVDSLEPVQQFRAHGGRVNGLVHSPDGRQLVTTTWEKLRGEKIKVWEIATGALVATLDANRWDTGDIYDMVFSPDGALLATAAFDRQVLIWDADRWEQTATLFGHRGPVFDLSFSPDGSRLASGGAADVVRLWDLTTYQEVLAIDGMLAEFAPQDSLLITANGTWMPTLQRSKPNTVRLHRPPSIADIDRQIKERGGRISSPSTTAPDGPAVQPPGRR